jgi:hypothetical protein
MLELIRTNNDSHYTAYLLYSQYIKSHRQNIIEHINIIIKYLRFEVFMAKNISYCSLGHYII